MITRITYHYGEPRRKPQEGDVKIVRGVTKIRQQMMSEGAYCVRRGRPVFEWVTQENYRADNYRSGWVQPARKPKL